MENWEIHGNSKNPGFWINLRFFSDAPAFLAVSVSLGSECVFNMHDLILKTCSFQSIKADLL